MGIKSQQLKNFLCFPLFPAERLIPQAFNCHRDRLRQSKQGLPVVRARCNSGCGVVENEERRARVRTWSEAHGDRAWRR
ncbi:hypothetical protein V6Z12_A09G109100 [Gossypium hirsutum]|uniref:Uncharacterized protein n=1 Tax=Gossypium tomentosum TaxID=34277 RepID=A0A5D2P121_GOSTO|nr:hypothetical protein ES332_A09G111800v1 [Gossypium tomentosum]